MSISRLILNSECELYGKPHKVVAVDPPHVWLKRPDGESIQYDYMTLVTNSSFIPGKSMITRRNEINQNHNVLEKLKENKREEVSHRFEIIRPLLLLEKIKQGDIQSVQFFKDKYPNLLQEEEDIYLLKQKDLLPRIIKLHRISKATILRYLRDFRTSELDNNNGLVGLISHKGKGQSGRKDNKTLTICNPENSELILDTLSVRLSDKQIEILKKAIEKHYLTKLRVSKAAIHRIVERMCGEEEIPEIKYITICGIINRIDEKAKEMFRNYKKAKKVYDNVARGYADREALGRLDIIQIDHTQLDMQVIDDATGLVINRPWLTLGICVHSREPWCMYLSHEGPGANVVRKAIQHGVFIKNTIKEFGTQTEWAAFGVPNIIYVDNGMDFKSSDIKRLVNDTLESELRHRPVRLPYYGAVIERLFGTINRELIHNIEGTTKSNIFDRGELDPEEEAFLTLSQLRKILIYYLTDIYPFKPHRGLGNHLTPRLKYIESLQEMGYPHTLFEDEKERYKIDFLFTDKKSYTRDGVRWNNRIYKSDKCSDIIGTSKIKYIVKYDIDDISKIYLLHPKTNEFMELYCESPPYESVVGINQYTYKVIQKKARKEGEVKLRAILTGEQVKKGWSKIAEEIEEAYTKRKSVRKSMAKMGNIKVEVVTAYTEQQASRTERKKQENKIEEELFMQAKRAEERRGGGK